MDDYYEHMERILAEHVATSISSEPDTTAGFAALGNFYKCQAFRKHFGLDTQPASKLNLVWTVETGDQKRSIQRRWDPASGLLPTVRLGNVYRDFHYMADEWTGGKTPALWVLQGSVPAEAVEEVLSSLKENGQDAVTDQADGTLFSFMFVSAAGTRTRRQCGIPVEDVMALLEQAKAVEEMLDDLESCGICSVSFGQSEREEFGRFGGAHKGVESKHTDRVLITAFNPSDLSRVWSSSTTDCRFGCVHIKLRRSPTFRPQVDSQQLSWEPFTDTQTRNPKIEWEGNVFVDKHEQCHIRDPEAKLFGLHSVERCDTLADYAPLIHYVFYRLQTLNTNINHQKGWPEIRFPFPRIFDFFNEPTARAVGYKPPQCFKTSMTAALAWAYAFVRGFTVTVILRNIGARQTGVVGFKTKGIATINRHIRRFIEEIADQIRDNGWDEDLEDVIEALSLNIKTDQVMKWGESNSLRNTRLSDPRRAEGFAKQCDRLAAEVNSVLVLPLNISAMYLFIETMKNVGQLKRTVVMIDEADEPISSYARNGTCIERTMYPTGAGPGCLQSELFDANEDDDERDESEVEEELVDLFNDNHMKSIPHLIGITATIHPILFTNQDTLFYTFVMPVAPNYIGINTPKYCTHRVAIITDRLPVQPSQSRMLDADEWWSVERPVLERIYQRWEADKADFAACLITTSGTTCRVAKQQIGAIAIAHSTTFPIAAVVTNGVSTEINFSRHFWHVTPEAIRVQLVKRLKKRGDLKLLPKASFGACRPRLLPVDFEQLKIRVLPLANSFRIEDETGTIYTRQHPSVMIELVLAAFEAARLPHPRCCFLGTDVMCGREKSYVSFSGREAVTDMYQNYPAGQNMTKACQTTGRVCGVVTHANAKLKVRRLWINKDVYQDILFMQSLTDNVIQLLGKFRGESLDKISQRVVAGRTGLSAQDVEHWNRVTEMYRRTVTGAQGGGRRRRNNNNNEDEQPKKRVKFAKPQHQKEVNKMVEHMSFLSMAAEKRMVVAGGQSG
ncbi:uncharacterized protein EV422DRAFT_577206 [Fimicolochytrium jonesii]|uniref:uncharacterized protein n=1 Tax=Fimicolochytrium jonesii TaxID=1396493 RepID=UPI0022FE180C|nr:uncharacterized protein EV422DRAFT_577206 [Fimicolochytrium jonesii]KAI8823756.1 hypothetical protein EV422DRAFT_577206 [Fimicolochytrium jonesii]